MRRRAISPVVSTIILSAMVLAAGGGVWAYSQGAASSIASQYVDRTLDMVYDMREAFMIEQVVYKSENDLVSVWVSNYGTVNAVLDIYLIHDGVLLEASYGQVVDVGELVRVDITLSEGLAQGDWLHVQAYSRRQNNAYYDHFVE